MTRNEAVEYFGTQLALARALGISRMAVCMWGDTVPVQRQAQLQILSNGKLVAELPSPSPKTEKKRKRKAA